MDPQANWTQGLRAFSALENRPRRKTPRAMLPCAVHHASDYYIIYSRFLHYILLYITLCYIILHHITCEPHWIFLDLLGKRPTCSRRSSV